MILFICSSPFQILNAYNLTNSHYKHEKVDICILDHVASNYLIYEKLKEEEIFNDIFFLKTKTFSGGDSPYKLIRYSKTAVHYLTSWRITSQLKNKKNKYEDILISSPDVPSQIIYFYFKNRYKGTKLYMFEEGTFSYNYFDLNISPVKKLFIKFLFKRDIMADHLGGFVYKPEFMEYDSSITINKIPPIKKENSETVTLLNNMMGFKNSYLEGFSCRYIFFDQAFQFQSIVEQGKKLLQHIVNYTGRDNLVVKLHPRTDHHIYESISKINQVPIPFEMVTLNSDIRDKVLISVNSTACLNPKIIFDEEPIVILLFELVDFSVSTSLDSISYDIIQKVKRSYRDPKRFFIPKSFEELMDYLKEIE